MSNVGRFVWDELLTTEAGGAVEFYGSLLGWKAEERDMGPQGTYRIMTHADQRVGGIAQGKDGAPPHWLSYLTVENLDEAAKTIVALGGSLLGEAYEIPGVGRAVVAQDSTGGTFAAFEGNRPDQAPSEEPQLHGPCWRELVTDDLEAAQAFYTGLIGYSAEPMGEDVILLKKGDAMRGTLRKKPSPQAPTHWMVYFLVDDVAASTKQASSAGANVLMEPTDVPQMGSFSVLADPGGAVLALWKDAGAGG